MLIKLHQGQCTSGSHISEILVQAERISMVTEKYYIDFSTGGTKCIGSEITMNDCDYTKEGHKKKITILVTETVSEIYELIGKQIKFLKI